MKRLIDVTAGAAGLLVVSPIMALACLLIWLQDGALPFYVAPRVGLRGRIFRMVKLRTMVVRADRTGVDSTAASDPRITRLGRLIRRVKVDELGQLWNVLRGDMSLVGPRPQTPRDVALYTEAEQELMDVRPGVTDFASIVFADEGEILAGAADPDLRYNQVIRPWKSRLGIHYVRHQSTWLDLQLVMATLLNALWRRHALAWVASMLSATQAHPRLVGVARRRRPVEPTPPPGATQVVRGRAPTVSSSS